jgi:hypothetical protein
VVTVNNTDHELTAQQVRQALRDAAPERIRHDAVRVDGRAYPIKQAYALASGRERGDFTADTARRQLSALGFEIIPARRSAPPRGPAASSGPHGTEPVAAADTSSAWHLRESLQAVLVDHLTDTGWAIAPGGGSGAHERDIMATTEQESVVAHVTGYPAPGDAGPAHPGLHQPGQPSPLAVTWFAQAILAAMRNRTRRPAARSVVVLPAAPGYEELFAETAGSLAASSIEVWWLDKRGDVSVAVAPG